VHINSGLDNKAFCGDALYLLISNVFRLHGGSLAMLCSDKMTRGAFRGAFLPARCGRIAEDS
jgi:hypothetical protein